MWAESKNIDYQGRCWSGNLFLKNEKEENQGVGGWMCRIFGNNGSDRLEASGSK